MLPLVAGGIAAIGSILSGRRQANSQRQANASNMAFAREQFEYQKRLNNRNIKLQKNFAKNSAGWQFDDLMDAADQAGIHRLSAIGGASAAQYSPVSGTGLDANQASVDNGYIGDAALNGVNAFMAATQMQNQMAMDEANVGLRQEELKQRKLETKMLREAQSRTDAQRYRHEGRQVDDNSIKYIMTSSGEVVPVPLVDGGVDEAALALLIEGGGKAKAWDRKYNTPKPYNEYHGIEGNVGPPKWSGNKLGQIHRPKTGEFEYQWTKGGWKRRKKPEYR